MSRWLAIIVVFSILAIGSASVSHAGFNVIQGDMLKLSEGAGVPGGIFSVDVFEGGSYGDIDFYTMCVEVAENITFGTVYKVSNDVLTDGFQTRNTNKLLSEKTAWLYTQANLGTLPFFDSAVNGAAINGYFSFPTVAPMLASTTARDQANALQLAIWQGMGWTDTEIAGIDGSGGLWNATYISTLTSLYLDRADDRGWLDLYEDDTAWSGFGNVRIMNLVKMSPVDPNVIKSYHQDQLVWLNPPPPGASVPELPTFYTASALIVGALIGVVAKQRRK
jgi:hypothetical protein